MVLVNLHTKTAEEAERVITLLLDKKLILDATVTRSDCLSISDNQAVQKNSEFVIRARAKALLFETIQHEIQAIYGKAMPLLFATPIVYMEPGQAADLRNKTQSI